MTQQRQILKELSSSSSHKKIWVAAAAVALTCHVAFAAFALSRLLNEPDDEDLGAPGVEIALELTSPKLRASDLPPGPESEASVASRAAVEQKEEKSPDLPKETPKESDDPERQVSREKSKTPNENQPKEKVSNASEESLAQKAAATPAIESTLASPKSATVDQGTGRSKYRARISWQKELLAHLDKYKHYPDDRSGLSAKILLRLTLDRTGRVLSSDVLESSGDPAFDKAALAMIEKASPVPAPPPLVADEGLVFSLPVIFQERHR
jgi:TonB family protein